MDFNIEKLLNQLRDFAPTLVAAIVLLIVGFWIIGKLTSLLKQFMIKKEMDPDLVPFLTSLASIVLKILLVFSAAEMVGIKTTSFVALIAAAGFAVGMALQGSLGNFASGVLILFFKPFKSGQLIEINGQKGWVQEINIFNTILKTATNQQVIVPNSKATEDTIINHSANGHVRVDLFFAMPYEEDFDKVEKAIIDVIYDVKGALINPKASVDIEKFDSHNIEIGVFFYCLPKDYWDAYYDGHLKIKKALGNSGIKMAYSEGIELGKIGKN